ncbi:hypothetical protein HN51_001509 [Arachis hypogaea]|uniref:Uncharacterized protein LOC107488038 n=1 Tax=Arachis duranensis TaxID=130453 RepID=A0A6P4D915_ARADU|nr:uncharacterized protein LOC107488038 [Arachis duranensis]XP_025702954.1 peptidyl-tRNA hydrolase ICT1, mitochondrial [Arachis hypogaea]XP_025702962.1 peptidyl-tRNA hydrolase ICT1, mitochondrial [Arachis hypogaea]QHO49621.1 Peptidyl-tRNA hydrolase ICT1 [Arachis hypogaea]
MATTTSRTLLKEMLHLSSTLPFSFSLRLRALPSLSLSSSHLNLNLQFRRSCPSTPFTPIRCVSSSGPGDGGNKVSSRLSQVHQLLQEAEERALSADTGPTPKITLDHVTVSYARSGGPGGQNVNKVNTKVDMRFNVKNAYWLSDRIRERIMQMEKNRINKDGELVISSTRTRTQKGNIEDALAKLQEIIDAAAYVPPPPSEEQKKKIAKMAAIGEQKRLKSKKVLSDKKAFRRSKNSWD